MNFTQQFVAMTMATLNIDGRTEEIEYLTIRNTAKNIGLNHDEVEEAIKAEMEKPTMLHRINTDKLSYEEKLQILEACVLVALCDKELAMKEVAILNIIARSMALQEELVTLYIAKYVQGDRSMVVEGM